jgi:hypothetical protein
VARGIFAGKSEEFEGGVKEENRRDREPPSFLPGTD